ncbi:hypothetical protein BJY00DRAFT_312742 [Aspergillus carlsbadensis]|nr:hypothetical protein BJY00DRAFT_312742 [Aspergillus carlsbadensis]
MYTRQEQPLRYATWFSRSALASLSGKNCFTWQYLFLIFGAATCLCGVLILVLLPNGHETALWLRKSQRRIAASPHTAHHARRVYDADHLNHGGQSPGLAGSRGPQRPKEGYFNGNTGSDTPVLLSLISAAYTVPRVGLVVLIFYCFSAMRPSVYESPDWNAIFPPFLDPEKISHLDFTAECIALAPRMNGRLHTQMLFVYWTCS